MMKYRIGAEVFSDGILIGQIQYLVIDPRSCEVTHLVVGKPHIEMRKMIALAQIEILTKRAIVLGRQITWSSLKDYLPQYYQDSLNRSSYVRTPLPSLHPLYYYPPLEQPELMEDSFHQDSVDDAILHEGVLVYDDTEQHFGVVLSRGEDTEGNLTHLVIQMLNEREIYVPLSWILYTSTENIYLNVSRRFAG